MYEVTKKNEKGDVVPFDVALDRTGFGLYNFSLLGLTGLSIISFVCVAYGTTILIPINACELETTVGQQGFLAAGPMVGLIVGAIGWGYVGDLRGRKNMLFVSLVSSATVNALASLSVNWIMLMVLQFLASILASGKYTLGMSLLSESVPMVKRNIVVLLVTSIFMLSQGLMAVLAIPIVPLTYSYYLPALGIYWNSWRTLVVVFSLPSIVSAIWLTFVQESPKFVYTKGDHERALEILKKIHSVNKGKSKELNVKGFLKNEEMSEPTNAPKVDIRDLFKTPLLKFTLIVTTLTICQQIGAFNIWFPTIANHFVSTVQTGQGADMNLCGIIEVSMDAPPDPDRVPCSLNTNALLVVMIFAIVQSLVNLLVTSVINKVGRRNMVIIVVSVCGVSGIIVSAIPNAIGSAILFVVFMLGKLVMGLYTAITVTLFPTHLRALAVALTVTGGRIALAISTQILNWLIATNCQVGFYVFTSIYTLSAVVVSFLPDDRYMNTQPVQQTKANGEKEISTEL